MPIIGTIASSTRQGLVTDLGAMFPLQVITVGPSGTSAIDFTNIPATYTHLQLRMLVRSNRSDQTGDFFQANINNDYGNNYSWHFLSGNGSTTFIASGSTTSLMEVNRFPGSTVTANSYGAIILDILDYANTNKFKTLRYLGGWDGNGSGQVYFGSGLWQNTNAINRITLNNSGGRTIQPFSSVALYGIKVA